jgi:hypothetical protein
METGFVTPIFEGHGVDWDYFTVCRGLEAAQVLEEDDGTLPGNFYTLTYLVHPAYQPSIVHQRDGRRQGGLCAQRSAGEAPEKPSPTSRVWAQG